MQVLTSRRFFLLRCWVRQSLPFPLQRTAVSPSPPKNTGILIPLALHGFGRFLPRILHRSLMLCTMDRSPSPESPSLLSYELLCADEEAYLPLPAEEKPPGFFERKKVRSQKKEMRTFAPLCMVQSFPSVGSFSSPVVSPGAGSGEDGC